MPNQILEYHLAIISDVDRVQMTRNSSAGQTNGRGNNNMLEFSLESTSIINIFTMITLTKSHSAFSDNFADYELNGKYLFLFIYLPRQWNLTPG